MPPNSGWPRVSAALARLAIVSTMPDSSSPIALRLSADSVPLLACTASSDARVSWRVIEASALSALDRTESATLRLAA